MKVTQVLGFVAACAAILFSFPVAAQNEFGEFYIASDEGEIILFALPGCEVYGKKGRYGHAEWKTEQSEIICWQYDNMIYIQTTEGNRTIIFDPTEVRTRGANDAPSPSFSALTPAQFLPTAGSRFPG